MRAMFLATILVGCGGVSEDKFHEQYAADACGLIMECGGGSTSFFDSVETCEAWVAVGWALVPDDCDYDAKVAKDCLDALGALSCDDYAESDLDACVGVYSGGDDCSLFSETSTYTYGYTSPG